MVSARAPDHDELVAPLTALGKVERAEGHLKAAADTLTRALAIAVATKGPTNDLTGDVHIELSAVYEERGDYESAARHAEGVIAAYESGWRDRQGYARALLQRSRIRLKRGISPEPLPMRGRGKPWRWNSSGRPTGAWRRWRRSGSRPSGGTAFRL